MRIPKYVPEWLKIRLAIVFIFSVSIVLTLLSSPFFVFSLGEYVWREGLKGIERFSRNESGRLWVQLLATLGVSPLNAFLFLFLIHKDRRKEVFNVRSWLRRLIKCIKPFAILAVFVFLALNVATIAYLLLMLASGEISWLVKEGLNSLIGSLLIGSLLCLYPIIVTAFLASAELIFVDNLKRVSVGLIPFVIVITGANLFQLYIAIVSSYA